MCVCVCVYVHERVHVCVWHVCACVCVCVQYALTHVVEMQSALSHLMDLFENSTFRVVTFKTEQTHLWFSHAHLHMESLLCTPNLLALIDHVAAQQ